MMIALEAKTIRDSSAPGWWIQMTDAHFLLWAPKESRPYWQACWEMWTPHPSDPDDVVDGSMVSEFVRGDSLEDVLVAFDKVPDSDLGTRVRRLLSGAATGLDPTLN